MMGKHLDLDGMWQRTFGMYWGTCDYPIIPYQGFNSFCLNSHPQQRRRNQDRGVDTGDLVEKKESPKGERAVKPVISLPSEKWVLKIGFLKVQNW